MWAWSLTGVSGFHCVGEGQHPGRGLDYATSVLGYSLGSCSHCCEFYAPNPDYSDCEFNCFSTSRSTCNCTTRAGKTQCRQLHDWTPTGRIKTDSCQCHDRRCNCQNSCSKEKMACSRAYGKSKTSFVPGICCGTRTKPFCCPADSTCGKGQTCSWKESALEPAKKYFHHFDTILLMLAVFVSVILCCPCCLLHHERATKSREPLGDVVQGRSCNGVLSWCGCCHYWVSACCCECCGEDSECCCEALSCCESTATSTAADPLQVNKSDAKPADLITRGLRALGCRHPSDPWGWCLFSDTLFLITVALIGLFAHKAVVFLKDADPNMSLGWKMDLGTRVFAACGGACWASAALVHLTFQRLARPSRSLVPKKHQPTVVRFAIPLFVLDVLCIAISMFLLSFMPDIPLNFRALMVTLQILTLFPLTATTMMLKQDMTALLHSNLLDHEHARMLKNSKGKKKRTVCCCFAQPSTDNMNDLLDEAGDAEQSLEHGVAKLIKEVEWYTQKWSKFLAFHFLLETLALVFFILTIYCADQAVTFPVPEKHKVLFYSILLLPESMLFATYQIQPLQAYNDLVNKIGNYTKKSAIFIPLNQRKMHVSVGGLTLSSAWFRGLIGTQTLIAIQFFYPTCLKYFMRWETEGKVQWHHILQDLINR